MHLTKHNICRNCDSPIVRFLDFGPQYNQGSFVFKNQKTEPSRRKIPNVIAKCVQCHLVQSAYSVPHQILYSHYGYESSISNTMRTHLSRIAASISEVTKTVASPSILDIGCNDFYFLNQFSSRHSKFGIDPSDVSANTQHPNITFQKGVFPDDLAPITAKKSTFDIITSLACLYDVDDIHSFVEDIFDSLHEKGLWVFEVAYLPLVLKNLAYDGMVIEHVCLYSLATLENVLRRHNLKVVKASINDINGGSLQCWVTFNNNTSFDNATEQENLDKIRIDEFELRLDEDETYSGFARRVQEHAGSFRKLIEDILRDNKSIHIYGMSTKLNMVLQYCGIGPDQIKYAAERNPKKWGGKTLEGIEMISEEESRAMRPDYYLIGPYFFKDEILAREEAARQAGTKFIFPLPKIEVI